MAGKGRLLLSGGVVLPSLETAVKGLIASVLSAGYATDKFALDARSVSEQRASEAHYFSALQSPPRTDHVSSAVLESL